MADARFFRTAGRFSLGALASLAEARLVGGDPDAVITDVAPLEHAARDQIAFLDNTRYLDQARVTRGGRLPDPAGARGSAAGGCGAAADARSPIMPMPGSRSPCILTPGRPVPGTRRPRGSRRGP